MSRFTEYYYIIATILFTVYGQLALKFALKKYEALPNTFYGKLKFISIMLLNPIVISVFVSVAAAGFFWILAIKKLELSKAYPLMSLSFLLVVLMSDYFMGEKVSLYRYLGVFFIVAGSIIVIQK